MADLRIPPPSLPSVRPAATPGPRTEAVRAAQQAFFRAALDQTPEPAAKPELGPAQPAATAAPDPQRPLRPGSLLDIKV